MENSRCCQNHFQPSTVHLPVNRSQLGHPADSDYTILKTASDNLFTIIVARATFSFVEFFWNGDLQTKLWCKKTDTLNPWLAKWRTWSYFTISGCRQNIRRSVDPSGSNPQELLKNGVNRAGPDVRELRGIRKGHITHNSSHEKLFIIMTGHWRCVAWVTQQSRIQRKSSEWYH